MLNYMNKKISIKINGKKYIVNEDQTILKIAEENNVYIPNLCYHPDLQIKANCRVCAVEIKGQSRLTTSCSTIARNGMEIFTNSEKVKKSRNTNLELIFSTHAEKCFDCNSKFNCLLLDLAKRYDIKINKFIDRKAKRTTYKFDKSVEIDGSQCIDCQNCVDVCSNIQKIGYLEIKGKGSEREIIPTKNKKIDCIYCGQCTVHCPVTSAQEQSQVVEVEKLLKNKGKNIIVAIFAPSTRITIGESFSLPYGQNNSQRMIGALKNLGFDKVMDVDFAADTTTLVEATELLERLNSPKAKLPLMTSCCPAWVKYLEFYRPDLIPNLTSSRSPHIQLGGIIKTYWAKAKKIKPENIKVVSIMPCTAKKFEISRSELKIGNNYPVDNVLTVRELSYLIKKNNIDFKKIIADKPDTLINNGSSAGLIFGASGGVMESALRTAAYVLNSSSKNKIKKSRLEFKEVRGQAGVREAQVVLSGKKLRVAIVSGIGNIKEVLKNLKKYDYIEVMSCPGGCIAGGGQPIPTSKAIVAKRTAGIYQVDKNSYLRSAHDNKGAIEIIKWLEQQGLDHQVLHTKYFKKIKKQ